MKKKIQVITSILILISFLTLRTNHFENVKAQAVLPTPEGRNAEIEVTVIEYHWQLTYWSDHSQACDISFFHDGEPTADDILNGCGISLFETYQANPDCETYSPDKQSTCTGVYLQNSVLYPVPKTIQVTNQPAVIWISLTGCETETDSFYCTGSPIMVLSGDDPLPNQSITRIY